MMLTPWCKSSTKKLQTLLFSLIVSEDKLLFAQLIEVRFHFKILLQCFIKKWAMVGNFTK